MGEDLKGLNERIKSLKYKEELVMNKCFEQGRWTKDLSLSFIPGSGLAVAKGTLAVDGKPKKDGEKTTDFIPVVLFGKMAENTANYCGNKGDKIGIWGHLKSGNYKDKHHEDVTHYTLDLIADEVDFQNPKKGNTASTNTSVPEDEMTPVDDGDIPF